MEKYSDIINLPHHVSATHKPMSLDNRAAQFAPFAALTGHNAAINETARLTSNKIELSADEQKVLSAKLNIVLEHVSEHPYLTFTIFIYDELKSGGKYIQISGEVKKYDEYERVIILTDGKPIKIEDITEITGDILMDL